MARQTKITVETDSVLMIRSCKSLKAWCPKCHAEVEMIPFDGVGVISNLTPVEVEAWIQSSDLHHTRTTDGALLICLNSMLKHVHRAKLTG